MTQKAIVLPFRSEDERRIIFRMDFRHFDKIFFGLRRATIYNPRAFPTDARV